MPAAEGRRYPTRRNRTFALVYGRLQRIAAGQLRRELGDAALQTASLVHETYLQLSRQPGLAWRSREHFFAFASRVMRRVLVDHARRRRRAKRGGGKDHVTLAEATAESAEAPEPSRDDVLAVHEALEALEAIDPDRALLVELRFFGGFSVAETATALEVSEATVQRRWRVARAWLFTALHGPWRGA